MSYKLFFDNINYLVSGCNKEIVKDIEECMFLTTKLKSRVFLFGNGGSYAICDHIANDLNKRCNISALTLSNASLLTCYANDYGYESIFSQFLSVNRANIDDVVIFISSSGKSPNIMNGLAYCNNSKCKNTALICGFDGHEEDSLVRSFIKHYIYFPSKNYGEIELASEMVLHAIVESIVEKLNEK